MYYEAYESLYSQDHESAILSSCFVLLLDQRCCAIDRNSDGSHPGDDKKSVVTVTFRNDKRPEIIKFHLRNGNAGWRIENIVYTDESDLIKILSSPQ
ncbi:MAG TPA: hypothetical protein VLR90_10215 [Blastocatellia bacterium]|nr:hypothetical protein [Blastocatellia bacterium]